MHSKFSTKENTMSMSVGPLTVSWGVTQPNNKTNNISPGAAAAFIAGGAVAGALANQYVAPVVLPPVKAAVINGTNKTVDFISGLWNKKTQDNKNAASVPVPAQPRRWYLLWLA